MTRSRIKVVIPAAFLLLMIGCSGGSSDAPDVSRVPSDVTSTNEDSPSGDSAGTGDDSSSGDIGGADSVSGDSGIPAVNSISNEVEGFERVGEDLLIVHLATDLYAPNDPLGGPENISPCFGATVSAKTVLIQLDPQSSTDALETNLMQRVIETAMLGPFRITLSVQQDGCIFVPERGGDLPLAVGVTVKQCKDNINRC